MATYVNNLRLKEIATGAESGTWGTSTNTNLELIADAFGSGTEAITTNADTHTTTIADGSADEGRAIYMKYTGTLDSACTITLAPNTINKFWIIENATSGSQNIIISQGSGANITIGNGNVSAIFTDGAGSGAAVLDALADLELSATLTVAGNVDFNGNLDVDGTTNLDAVDIDGAVQVDSTITVGADDTGYDVKFFGDTASAYMLWDTSADDLVLAGAAGIDLAGDLDVDGTTNLDAVDIDGAVQIDSTVTVGVDDTGYDVKLFGATASAYMLWDASADDLVLAGAAGIDLAGDLDVDGTTNLDAVDIDGAVQIDAGVTVGVDDTGYDVKFFGATASAYMLWDASADDLVLAGAAGIDLAGDLDVDGTTNLDVVDIDGAVDMASTLTLGSTLTVNAGAVFNEASADVDFRVESNGNANMLFVDGGNNKVGLGTATPNTILTLYGSTATGGIYINSGSDEDHTIIDMSGQSNGGKLIWDHSQLAFSVNKQVFINGTADQIQLLVQGHSTQNEELVVFETSDGANKLEFTNAGNLELKAGTFQMSNNVAIKMKESGGTARDILTLNSSNIILLGNDSLATKVTADLTVAGEIVVSGTGPHVIGGSTHGAYRLRLLGAFTSDGSDSVAIGTFFGGTITGAVGDTDYLSGTFFDNAITTQGTNTNITVVSQVRIAEPNITNNLASSGKPDIATSLYIHAAPTEGDSNASLWVQAGATHLGGTAKVYVDNSSASTAETQLLIEQDGTGDAVLGWTLTGATTWQAYVDNSDSDKWKLRRSTTDWLTVTEVGLVTLAGNLCVGTASDTSGIALKKDGGTGSVGLDLHNSGTNAADDVQINFETEGQIEWACGIDRTTGDWVLGRNGTLGSNVGLTLSNASTPDVTIAGDLAVGTTLRSDLHSAWSHIFLGEKGSLYSDNDTGAGGIDGMFLTDNLYLDSDTGAFAYIETNQASYIKQEAGVLTFANAASGTGGAAATLTTQFTVDASGNVAVKSGKSLFLDGGTHTYLEEYEDNKIEIVANGVRQINIMVDETIFTQAATFQGSVSKASGSFKIDHPLPDKKDTHHLVHSFHEGPRADLWYRGEIALSSGSATVDLDEAAGMSAGTWDLLCRDPQVWIQNDSGWDAVRGSVSGSTLTIECSEASSSDTVSWMVVAERCDQHMIDTKWTDSEGRVIVEPEKPSE